MVPQALDRSAGAPDAKDWSARAAATVVWRDSCPRLAAVNPHARAAGLRPYMRLADSRTPVPDLVTTPVEPQADRRLIETLANWCDRYTPWVAIDPLGDAMAEEGAEACSAGGFGGDAGLLLDVTGCGHLFGRGSDKGEAGERALLADLVERLSRHDFACRAAMADTAARPGRWRVSPRRRPPCSARSTASATRSRRCRSTDCGSTSRSSRPS